eukprot:765000-Hanusia_phi.AAC.2
MRGVEGGSGRMEGEEKCKGGRLDEVGGMEGEEKCKGGRLDEGGMEGEGSHEEEGGKRRHCIVSETFQQYG